MCTEDFGGFEKSQSVEFRLGGRKLTFARSSRPCGGCHTWFGADEKVSIERWCLSPYVKKPFNSKVIKSFVPELRSRKFFSCFGIPMFYVMYVRYKHYMYILHICIMGMCYILTDAMNNRRAKNSLTKYTSHFIVRVRKGYSRFVCERELVTEHKL